MIKRISVLLAVMLVLCACANETKGENDNHTDDLLKIPRLTSNGTNLAEDSLEEGLDYIEALVGVDELSAAKGVLNELLAELNGGGTEEQRERITKLKQTLDEVEVSEEQEHHHEFTGVDAVALAVDRYGADDDIIYMYDENHEHYGDNQIGYYVALKSKVMQETEGGDGIILMLFVGDDGTITEL